MRLTVVSERKVYKTNYIKFTTFTTLIRKTVSCYNYGVLGIERQKYKEIVNNMTLLENQKMCL